MAGASGSSNVVDDLIELSSKTDPNEYLKLFVTQQIADRRGFIGRMGPEVNITRNELGQLNALIAGRGDCGEAEAVEVKEEDGLGIMDTHAIEDQAHLVNYDSDNEIENDDLGYHSEEYFYDAHEDDENNHSNGNVVKRGITWLYKFRMEYGKPDGVKLSVNFDALNRISGKHRALFFSFLGDMVREHIGLKILAWNMVGSEARDKLWDEITRYFDVDLTVRKLVMNRLGQLLRNFRTKLRRTYILPNQDTPSKLNEVPAKYTAILKAEEWVNFVKYTATRAYKVKSAAGKMARSKCLYPHTMRRGGYAYVKEKMIEKKEIEQDEEPSRGTLWLKGRVNKDGDYPDDEIRSVGDKLKETEDKIKEGTLKVDQGTNAITIILGKEKGGYARGVGSGVTYKRYFDLPRSKQAADERILLLQSQLDTARRERQEKELLIQSMSSKMSQTEGLASLVDIHLVNSSDDEEGGTTIVGCDQNNASIQKEMQKRETVKTVGAKKMTRSIRKDSSSQDSQSKENVSVLPQAIKCKLWHLKKSTIIAEGTVYKSDGKIMLRNKALPKDCYKVSIDKSLVDAAFIPDVGNNGCITVLDAVGGFVAWPKNQVVLDPKATPLCTIQMITGENKTAPKVQTKRKNVYVSSDAMQKESNKKRSQKALVY
ncbi:transposase, Ptta/En/Spm, transposase, Tnp1/En/Spm-like protein [Tanacetum coccineum]